MPRLPKLRLAPLWPALAALATASLLLWRLLPGLLEEGAAVQLFDTLEILAPLVAAGGGEPAGLERRISALAAGRSLRITVIAGDGRVLADSSRTPAELRRMENHLGRPEVRQALASGRGWAVRRSATTGRPYVYAARTLTAPGGRLYVLRLAQPLQQLQALSGHLASAMGLALAAAVLALLLVSVWTDRRVFRPLARLISGAGELASGRYRHRVELPPDDDLASLGAALNRLGVEVERQLAAVQHERDHLQSILASMSEGVLVVGPDRRAILANPALRRLFDLPAEIAGRPVLELLRLPELARIVDETLATGRDQGAEVAVGAPERRTILLASSALAPEGAAAETGGAGGTGEVVVVARDTTESTRLSEMRRDFVANVSHELKTPLAAIRGYAETLRDGALAEPATAARFTGRILEHCRRLQALLDDLLTLSRLESLGLAVELEAVDLSALARRAFDLVAPDAAERGVTLALAEPPPPRPLVLEGDAEGLERLLVNLLDNAVKYNRPGGAVDLRLHAAGNQALLEVADTGIGIPQQALSRIFERFYRVDKGRARDDGGTGLGLAIVKHVAQAHGGQVEVESRMGQGSTFRVRLPLAPEPGAA